MIEHVIPGTKPRRIIFVGRGGWAPLMVDPESLKVQVYPGNETNNKWFPRFNGPTPDDAFLSDQGILWAALGYGNFSSYRLNDETGLLDPIRVHPESNLANMASGSLVREGEWLYCSGQNKWRRLNLRTGVEDLLLEYTNHLPHYGTSRTWHLYNSTHYGLVAFNEGCLYRVKITPNESAKNESIMNPERVATYAFLGSSLGLIFIANLYRRRRRKRAICSRDAG